MIEMRWKIEAIVKCDPGNNGIYGSKRTLQFRTASWPGQLSLGEWQDVPEFAVNELAQSAPQDSP